MVRVAGLKRRIMTGLAVPTNVGRAPHRRARRHLARRRTSCRSGTRRVYQRAREAGPRRGGHPRRDVGRARRGRARAPARRTSRRQIFPVLMPLAVDPAHPFPYISGLSLNLSVRVRNPQTGRQEFARLKVPQMLPRFVRVDPDESIERRCGTSPSKTSSPTTSATSSPAWRSSSTTCSASPATRTSRSRRTRPRTSSRRSRRSCCAAGSARRSASRSPTTWTT